MIKPAGFAALTGQDGDDGARDSRRSCRMCKLDLHKCLSGGMPEETAPANREILSCPSLLTRMHSTRDCCTMAARSSRSLWQRWCDVWLDPFLKDSLPFTTYYLAVIFVAWYAGRTQALLATVAGGLLATYLFVEPAVPS